MITGNNTGKKIRFEFNELKLTADSIVGIIGSKKTDDNDYVMEVTGNILKEVASVAEVKAEYRIFNDIVIGDADKSVSIEGVNFNVGRIIFPHLKKSEVFILFLCTAGHFIGEKSAEAMKGKDPLAGYILDIIGSEIVERAADLMQIHLSKQMSAWGLKTTNRYSPGYCGWYVAEQQRLFRFFENNFCGIKLTPSSLMQPVKSISGIIGAGANVKKSSYKCRLCDMNNCIYRRKEDGS